jgi:hypothetical protein
MRLNEVGNERRLLSLREGDNDNRQNDRERNKRKRKGEKEKKENSDKQGGNRKIKMTVKGTWICGGRFCCCCCHVCQKGPSKENSVR